MTQDHSQLSPADVASVTNDLRIAFFAVVVAFAALAAYVARFIGYPLGKPDDWGAFGDYLGGLINPAVGIVTVLLIVRTLQTTRREARETREQFKLQLAHMQRQHTLAEMQKRIDGLMAQLEQIGQASLDPVAVASTPNVLALSTKWTTIGQALWTSSFLSSVEEVMEYPSIRQAARDNWINSFAEPAKLINELAVYCDEYQQAASDRLVADFYRRRAEQAAKVLHTMKLVPDATLLSLAPAPLTPTH